MTLHKPGTHFVIIEPTLLVPWPFEPGGLGLHVVPDLQGIR